MRFKSDAEPAVFLFESFRADDGGIEEHAEDIPPLTQKAFERKTVFDEHIRCGSDDAAVAPDRRKRVEAAGHKVDRPLFEEGAWDGELLPVLPCHTVDPLHIVFLLPVERVGDEAACHEIGMNGPRDRRIKPPEGFPRTGARRAVLDNSPEFPRSAEIECLHASLLPD